MKRIFIALLTAISLIGMTLARAGDSDIYVCTDASGVKSYGNIGDGKGCKKVDLPGLSTFPATKKTAKAPSDFPRVDDSTQKKRDSERRQILSDELKSEQQKLADLNARYNNGEPDRIGGEKNYSKYQERAQSMKDDITRAQQNVDSLQRELNGLN